MLFWSALLFLLGVFAFLDSIFNYGEIFRQVNSVLFLLISLGILIRTTTKMRQARFESYIKRVEELEKKLNEVNRSKERSLY
jgi:hypothetical protein